MRNETMEAYMSVGLGSSRTTSHGRSASPQRGHHASPALPKRTALDAAFSRLESKDVVAAEHITEVNELIQDCHVTLKNLYRTKLVLGGYLKHVDPNFGSDEALTVFNLPTPAPFETYGHLPSGEGGRVHDSLVAALDSVPGIPNSEESKKLAPGISHDLEEKLKNSEDLIRKLYRKNTQLEADLLYYKNEVIRLERRYELQLDYFNRLYPYVRLDSMDERVNHAGIMPMITSERSNNNNNVTSGGGTSFYGTASAPLKVKLARRPRSQPPTRVLLRAKQNGEDVPVLSRDDRMNIEGDIRERMMRCDRDGGVHKLRERTLELTTYVVQLQHENDTLRKQKDDQDDLRNRLLKAYFQKRDQEITHMHRTIIHLMEKVNNPTKISKIRNISQSVSAAVTATSILKQTNKMLQEEILHNLQEALSMTAGITSHSIPERQDRRRALLERMKSICDALPTAKRKDLLASLREIKTLFSAMNLANETLENKYNEDVTEYERLLLQKKVQVATLNDRIQTLSLQNGERGNSEQIEHRK